MPGYIHCGRVPVPGAEAAMGEGSSVTGLHLDSHTIGNSRRRAAPAGQPYDQLTHK